MKNSVITTENYVFSIKESKELNESCLEKSIIHIDGKNYFAYKIK